MHIVKVSSQNRKLFLQQQQQQPFEREGKRNFGARTRGRGKGVVGSSFPPHAPFALLEHPKFPSPSLSNASALFVNTTDSLFRDVIHLARFSFYSQGILIGTLTMELGGVVTINCEKTGYKAEIEFKLKV